MANTQIGNKALGEMASIATSIKPAIEGVGRHFVSVIQNRLRSGQGASLGWTGGATYYNEEYAKRKKAGSQTPVYLVDTGAMVNSIQVLSGGGVRSAPEGRGSKLRGASGQFIRAEDANVSIGLPEQFHGADLARIHTSGKYGRKSQYKPRPFMGLTVQEADEVARMVSRQLYQAGGTEEIITLNLKFG
jgi:hypothetical protein